MLTPRDDWRVQADRPIMPGYGILDAGEGAGLLTWEWAEARLAGAATWWVSTVGAGRLHTQSVWPHTQPVWGVWAERRGWFSTGLDSRKARNLAITPRCTVAVEHEGGHVIVEGSVDQVALPVELVVVYREKYQWDGPVDDIFYAVTPEVVFGMVNTPGLFAGSATRWRA
jgi:hypothetical protein